MTDQIKITRRRLRVERGQEGPAAGVAQARITARALAKAASQSAAGSTMAAARSRSDAAGELGASGALGAAAGAGCGSAYAQPRWNYSKVGQDRLCSPRGAIARASSEPVAL